MSLTKPWSRLSKQWKESLPLAGALLLIVVLIASGSFIDDHIGLNIDQIGWVFAMGIGAMVFFTVISISIGFRQSTKARKGNPPR